MHHLIRYHMFKSELQAHLSPKLFGVFLSIIGRNWIIKIMVSLNTQTYKPDFLEMKDDQNIPLAFQSQGP